MLSDIVGAAAYNSGRVGHVSGITVRGSQLSIRLKAPAGDFPTRLSEPYFCPVPIGTPAVAGGVTRPIPSAGPYYIASSHVGETVLLRNPNYSGARPRRIERIVYTTGTPTEKALALVGGGAAEYMDGWTSDSDPSALGPDSPRHRGMARRAAPRGATTNATSSCACLAVDMIAFNTRRPAFRDVRMRRAVNYALDRRLSPASTPSSRSIATFRRL